MSMEFLKANLINTTTQIMVNSNTDTSSNLFNRDPLYQYYSDGLNNDLTSSSITITFDATTPVSRIALVDNNFKQFQIYYDNTTTNSITLLNSDTTVCSYTANADVDKYFKFATLQVASLTLKIDKTITADQEKVLGLFIVSNLNLALTLTPSASKYKPVVVPKQVVHKMSDGGTRIHNVRKKWDTKFSLDYVSTAQRDSLRDIYNADLEFIFCPFGTATGWDGSIYEAVWVGQFDFYEFSDNASSSGFSGKLDLMETPV